MGGLRHLRIRNQLILIIVLITVLCVGCKDKTVKVPEAATPGAQVQTQTPMPTPEPEIGFSFVHGGVEVVLGAQADVIIEALGEPRGGVFESPSCAFNGIDKIYYYGGFHINTYPLDSVDYVLSVNIMDDSVETSEGLYLGMTLDDVVAIYGDDYKQELGMYSYTLGATRLDILIEDSEVVQITYYYENAVE